MNYEKRKTQRRVCMQALADANLANAKRVQANKDNP